MSQNGLKMDPKWTQNGSKMASKMDPKMNPVWDAFFEPQTGNLLPENEESAEAKTEQKPSQNVAVLSRLVRLIIYLWRTTTEAGAFRHPPRLRWTPNVTVLSRLARLIMYLRGYYYGRWRFPSSAEAGTSTEPDGVFTPRATDNVS